MAREIFWSVLMNEPLSFKTFAVDGQRFDGMEPHFKDHKSAAFEMIRSGIRDAASLTNLLMLLSVAQLIAIDMGL